MSRSHLRRIGSIVVATAIVAFGLTPPAQAATPGTIAGTFKVNGAPAAGVYVAASSDGSYGSSVTDASGHYTIGNLEPGQYVVEFMPPNRPSQFAYGKADSYDADLITVVSGVTTTVNDSALTTGTIRGILTDSHSNPVPNASVAASSPSGGWGFGLTASDGSYAIAVIPGSYTVSFSIGSVEQFAHGKSYEDAEVFTVTANAATTVNETLLPTGSITGHVTRADGTPAAGVEVRAVDANGGDYATTDESGAYRLDYLSVGSYKVRFTLASGAAQYVHDQRSAASAESIAVTDGSLVTVDESLLPTGSIHGRLTTQAGVGLANVYVSIASTMDNEYVSTQTNADGDYAMDELFAVAGYKVHFNDTEQHVDQWATGKRTVEAADTFSVAAGAVTTVNDQKLAGGSLKITAQDSVTGASINSFYASVGDYGGTSINGSLIIDDVAAGPWQLYANADGYVSQTLPVTVTAGQQTVVTLKLAPTAKIKVKVVDRTTGAGLKDFIVLPVKPGRFVMPDGVGERTAADGTLTVETNQSGPYYLFVFPKADSGYGAQWVGSTGGTGSELAAETFTLSNGTTLTGPTIKVDKAGTITGKVTSVTGNPVRYGSVTMAPQSYHSGGGFGEVEVGADGTYRIDFLGPYTWPLLFRANDHAFQWSDGTGDRYHSTPATLPRRTTAGSGGTTVNPVTPPATDAPGLPRKTVTSAAAAFSATTTVTAVAESLPRRPESLAGVKVESGKTTVFNYTMKTGVSVKTVLPGPSGQEGFIDIYNAVTGDIVAIGWSLDLAAGAVNLLIPGTRVRFYANIGSAKGNYWCGGADFAHATTYTVTNTATQNFTCVGG